MTVDVDSSAAGRIVVGQPDVRLKPHLKQGRNPVVYHHGAANTAQSELGLSTVLLPAVRKLTDALVARGFNVSATTATQLWGNATAAAATTGRTALAVADARAQGAHATKKAIYVGASMGVTNALKAAANDPTKCACVIGVIPAIGLQELRVLDWGSARAVIDAAAGVTYPAALPAGYSPLDRTADLSGVPIQLWVSAASNTDWASGDEFSIGTAGTPIDIAGFATAVGADLHWLGNLGHTNTAIDTVDLASMLAFVEAHA